MAGGLLIERRYAIPGLLGVALHALLLAGALDAAPAAVRVAAAGFALVVAPGFAACALGVVPPGGARLAAGWALGFAVAWNALWLLIAHASGMSFLVLARALLALDAALWVTVWIIGRRARATPAAARAPGWSRAATIALMLALATGGWNAARLGGPLGYSSDSPDHIATIRRMVATGQVFPLDVYYVDAGSHGADPRKGLWHPQVALVSQLSRTDPVDTWRLLPTLLVPLFALNVAAFGFVLAGAIGAAAAAWALLLTYGGSFAEPYLREAVFSTKLGDQLSLACVVAVLADLKQRAPATRFAAAALGLAAVTTHVWYGLQLAMALGAFAIGLAARARAIDATLRRLLATAVVIGAVLAPYLAWRATQSYAPVNLIHTEPQGLMTLWDGVRVMNLGIVWDWMGVWWVVIPLSVVALWRVGREQPAVLYLLTTSVLVATLLALPPVVALLHPRLGYLLLRSVWMVPIAPLLGWWVARSLAELRGPHARGAAIRLAAMALLGWPAFSDAAQVLRDPERFARSERAWSFRRWESELRWLDRTPADRQVVLSDPITSYTIPMVTRHAVVTLLDQHSSPNDPLAIDRMLDARDALDPHASWDRVREVVDRWGATMVVLNDRFVQEHVLIYWAARHAWFGPMRARLDAAPAAFEPLLDHGDFVVYRIHRAALDRLESAPPPRPYVKHFDPERGGVARRIDDDVPALQGFRIAPAVAARGDTLRGVAAWRTPHALPRGSYLVAVRFDRELPVGFAPPRWISKPARKVIESGRGERYRFRDDHLPVGGDYGVDLWRESEVIADSFSVRIPADAAPGDYDVKVRFIRQAPYPNYRLSDYFFDDDYYSGWTVGRVRVRVEGRDPAEGVRVTPSEGH
ncbi:MAG: hypothetical protein HOP12_09850 [Candidatus Eisenbacteria bacterium]|uniref:Uncharacterized protein n=1 Tax=Eiseniibacteriota bacterium TaxID=2212470 RepID=A0A849SZE6_UNCEI|nr:hypothetical protein [Candidatus Eisenbacteria bacterium]